MIYAGIYLVVKRRYPWINCCCPVKIFGDSLFCEARVFGNLAGCKVRVFRIKCCCVVRYMGITIVL